MSCCRKPAFTERFKDHYFVGQQSVVGMAISLAFVYVAPQVGVLFLCTLFIIFNFASLRSTPRQTAVVWTVMALGLAGAVPADRQADLDAVRHAAGALRHHVGVRR